MSIAESTQIHPEKISLEKVQFDNEDYYCIENVDQLRPFFMSIVSNSNHWMFISSNGGITAGRKDADHALFPYTTDDKVTETFDITGSKTIFRIHKNGGPQVWEPFSDRFDGLYNYSRNLYKNALGNKILFEEINHDLDLVFRYQWSSSDEFGFIKRCWLINDSDLPIDIELVDGIQNIMPHGANSDVQLIRSNLVDAYKKSELEEEVGLGIYALSAIIVDRAEPSEALKANIAWSIGLDNPQYMLCSKQLDAFRKGEEINTEVDIKAEKGSYFVSKSIVSKPQESIEWVIIADVDKSASEIALRYKYIKEATNIKSEIIDDIERGSFELMCLTSGSDSLQVTADDARNTRHYSNTLFNIMRGGIFDNGYDIDKQDFLKYLYKANKRLVDQLADKFDQLPELTSYQKLLSFSLESQNQDLIRLTNEYLPLKFSRRHGDPSRPWNRFSINMKDESGKKVLDYEGNWRDIFQNWEALAFSYPDFMQGMIFKFLNASTFDGYNPYRVTKDGFDWEIIEENDPWSYIGYWGDHQIIYLQKFLEFIENHQPGDLGKLLNEELFVFANVPYRIKSYSEILKDPKDTIEFDSKLDFQIRSNRDELGADGALIYNQEEQIVKVNLVEKLLVMALAKLSNFIPEGGIWLNTQRPEWNDANNALVGNGVSMVTLYYLRRFFHFFHGVLNSPEVEKQFKVSAELYSFFQGVERVLAENINVLSGSISDRDRRVIMDGLGIAGSDYREKIYHQHYSGKKETLDLNDLQMFSEYVLKYLDHSISANKRKDGMYHAYNIMSTNGSDVVNISYLDEMLEGQVAVLSSGKLTAEECLEVLDGMKSSRLFREDQYSYILYPNKELPRFLAKNNVPESSVKQSSLLTTLEKDGNIEIIEKDINGSYHFNGSFTNGNMLDVGLSNLSGYEDLVEKDRELILQIYEEVFNHKAFTGRSGTFYGYEGLGSIYWHMVSKLLLAVEECCFAAVESGASEGVVGRLMEHFYEINAGIGVHKSPELYGAFPTDPYSHTPFGKGVQQPGMTGQVKEDIITRIGELGVVVRKGEIHFSPCLLKADEFLGEGLTSTYIDIDRREQKLELKPDSLAFTYCQVPVIYQVSESSGIRVNFSDGTSSTTNTLNLDTETSRDIFSRSGKVQSIEVSLEKEQLR